MSQAEEAFHIVLIDDEEDDYVLIRDMLRDIRGSQYRLKWIEGFDEAVNCCPLPGPDAFLLDYRLGERNGLELMEELRNKGFESPMIILTGHGDYEIDFSAMKGGAADYLEKALLSPPLLERAVRYAIERSKNMKSLQESERRLREISERLIDSQERERKIIARELHDSIGSNLTAIKYAMEEIRIKLERGEDISSCSTPLDRIVGMVKETITETQRISTDLRPAILDDMGLLAGLRSVCRKIQEVSSGMRIESTLNISEDGLPEELKICLYRILQEALNNATKHSGAEKVEVLLHKNDNGLELLVRDNGEGFTLPEEPGPGSRSTAGMGLVSMRERAELSGGNLTISSARGRGTTVRGLWSLPRA